VDTYSSHTLTGTGQTTRLRSYNPRYKRQCGEDGRDPAKQQGLIRKRGVQAEELVGRDGEKTNGKPLTEATLANVV
jgi:hypothetical protein